MKINFLSSTLALMMLGLAATSCSNDLSDEISGTKAVTMKLAKSPDVNVWSGSQSLFGGAATRAEGDFDEDFTQPVFINDDVEVNLSINDVHFNEDGTQKYDATDLISKLSVHIRNGNDVRITIPVPKTYYCDQDDLYIFNRHGGDIFANGGEIEDGSTRIEVKVGTKEKGGSLPSTGGCGCSTELGCNCDYHDADQNCGCDNMECNCRRSARGINLPAGDITFTEDELTETVVLNLEFREDDIVIYTEGITEGIIEWCKEHFNDGLNFEVYNYYNRSNMPVVDEEGNVVGGQPTASYAEWTLSELKAALDGSVIEFEGCIMSEAPDFYVNAFTGKTISHGGQLEYRDCYVRVIDGQGDWFEYPYFNSYNNGFDMNLIYQNLKLEFEDGEENPAYNHMPDYDDFFGVGKATVPVE